MKAMLTFQREHGPFDEELRYSVCWGGERIGEVSRALDEGEWVADSELEVFFGKDVAAGYTRISDVMKEFRRVAKGQNAVLMESIAQLIAQCADHMDSIHICPACDSEITEQTGMPSGREVYCWPCSDAQS